jgi:hypothetical protein
VVEAGMQHDELPALKLASLQSDLQHGQVHQWQRSEVTAGSEPKSSHAHIK